jgi:ribosomal protein S18 acetylase RimI-like enzyme
MQIKKIAPEELAIIQEIAHKTWPDTFRNILSVTQIDYMLEWMYNLDTLSNQVKSGHEFYVFEEKNIVLGFIGIEPFHPDPDSLKIHKLYVLPESQGLGVGKQLIEKSKEVAFENGISNLVLNVNRFNNAVEFYTHLGFTVVKEEDIDIGNGYLMEDYVMSLTIR